MTVTVECGPRNIDKEAVLNLARSTAGFPLPVVWLSVLLAC